MAAAKAIFPGTFDPFTKGHYDIVMRGAHLFDQVIVGIGENAAKSRYFSQDTIQERLTLLFESHANIIVTNYQGLTATFAANHEAGYILRGLRNMADFEYEKTISQANSYLNSNLETVFLMTSPALASISSSVIREIHKNGGDISSFLPYSL